MENELTYFGLFLETIIQTYVMTCPPSGVAVMFGLTSHDTTAKRLAISKQVCIIAAILLLVFAFLGKFILDDVFHLSTDAFRIGGGLYVFAVGLSMVISKDNERSDDADLEAKRPDSFSYVITPLATPLVVGPGALTATLVKRMTVPDSLFHSLTFYGGLLTTAVLIYFTFVLGCKFAKFLTPSILKVIEKLAGLLITCLGVGSVLSGTNSFLQNL
jgi:multiple antibiotic resistance protein